MRDHVGRPALPITLRTPERPGPGVNLAGFLEAESGLGEIARRLAAALERGGIPLAAISYKSTPRRKQDDLEPPLASEARYDTNLICLNADTLAQFAADAGAGFFAQRYSVGVWFWETNVFRAEDRAATRFLDEVWVASDYVRRTIGVETDLPMHVMPVPVEPLRGPFLPRSELGLPDGFTFLFLFDFVSAQRKNPTAVVRAFTRAFAPGEGPMLVLKSINGRERKPHQLEALIATAGGRDDIIVRDGYVSTAERDSYIAASDCYVSLHRSEGFGLTMAEAMACAKPVIATGYSGNLEFMNEENSYLVPYRLVEIPHEWWAYARDAQWAEPDVGAAARLMRRAYERPEEARATGALAAREVLDGFSLDRTTRFAQARLAALSEGSQPALRARAARGSTIAASLELGRGIEAHLAGGRAPARLLRQLLRRTMWPYLTARHRLDSSVLDGLVSTQRSVEDLERRIARLESESLEAGAQDQDVSKAR